MAANLPWEPTDELSWLVLADWLDENGGGGDRVRDEIAEDCVTQWHHEFRRVGGGGGVG